MSQPEKWDTDGAQLRQWMYGMLHRQRQTYPFPLDREAVYAAALPGLFGAGLLETNVSALASLTDRVMFCFGAQIDGEADNFWIKYETDRVGASDIGFVLPTHITSDPLLRRWRHDVSVVDKIIDMERYIVHQAAGMLNTPQLLEEFWPVVSAAAAPLMYVPSRFMSPKARARVGRALERAVGRESLDRIQEKVASCILLPDAQPTAWVDG